MTLLLKDEYHQCDFQERENVMLQHIEQNAKSWWKIKADKKERMKTVNLETNYLKNSNPSCIAASLV